MFWLLTAILPFVLMLGLGIWVSPLLGTILSAGGAVAMYFYANGLEASSLALMPALCALALAALINFVLMLSGA